MRCTEFAAGFVHLPSAHVLPPESWVVVFAADTSGSGKLPHLTICLVLKHGLLLNSIGTASFNLKKKRDQIKSI